MQIISIAPEAIGYSALHRPETPAPTVHMALYEEAVNRVYGLMELGHPIINACSFGKDSSAALAVTLEAAKRAKQNGLDPFVYVTHADTGIENVSVRNYADKEIEKVLAYRDKHGLNVEVEVALPSLNDGWAVRVLSGRAMPSFPGGNADCSESFKIIPMRRLVGKLFERISQKFEKESVTIIGTRFDESTTRGNAMTARGESWETPVQSKHGNLVLSAIANWTEDDVYELIAYVNQGYIETYSDFEALYELYRDGGGGGCVATFADIGRQNADANKKQGGCGARFGCHLCTRVKNDKSLESMIASEPEKYGFMRGINKLREYLILTRWDFNRRMWVGRSIVNGWIAIQPDSYSPAFVLELLRICLSLDAEEIGSAAKLNMAPRFTLIDIKTLVMIDAIWSLQGYHKPFQAIREWHEVHNLGRRYSVPETQEFKRSPMPAPRYFYVGADWDNFEFYGAGLHSTAHDIFSEEGFDTGCMGHRMIDVTAKDSTNHFFSEKYESLEDLPAGAKVAMPDMENVIQASHLQPHLEFKVARGKASEMLAKLSDGEFDAVVLPSNKLSKKQIGESKGIGRVSIERARKISVLNVEKSDEIQVDAQAAYDALLMYLPEMLETNDTAPDNFNLTYGYRFWVQLGTISLPNGSLRKIDSVLRRTGFKERNGLAGANYNLDDVLKRSVSKQEFIEACIAAAPTAAQIRAEKLADMQFRQNQLANKVSQQRISIADLYRFWSPIVNWKQLIRGQCVRSVRIPRAHKKTGHLRMQRFVHLRELTVLIKNNSDVRMAVKAYRSNNPLTPVKRTYISLNQATPSVPWVNGLTARQADLFGV